VYIYLSNENGTPVEVYFDDFKVTHTKTPIVQSNDYYPFGLTFNSYQRENSVENKFKFQGQEHIDDLNLGWDSFKWRNHQPDIGRFFNVDPLAEKYYYNSPYAFSENKVVAHVELEGLEAESIVKKEIQKAVEPIVNEVKEKVEGVVNAIGKGIKEAWNSIGPGDDRGGSTWTTKEHSGGDQSKVPQGQSDGGGNIDILIDPTIRSSPARTFAQGFVQGVEAVTYVEEQTHVIENVVKETGGNTTSLKVKEVKDTISDYKYMSQYLVTTTSGKDSIIQTSKTPDKQDDKKK
jgi:RHS repeat-associated protein